MSDRKGERSSVALTAVPSWLQNGFHRFLPRYLRRHFTAVAITSESRDRLSQIGETEPLIVYANHPSWWDPLIAHFLNHRLLPGRQFRAPIDAVALEHYGVFKKLGFFGVRQDHRSGVEVFLRTSAAILQATDASGNSENALWITPEGRFADARDQSERLMPGLAHLCHRGTCGRAMPLAMEYVFWDERLPLCLIQLGDPLSIGSRELASKAQWSKTLEDALRNAQASLAQLSIARKITPFENLLVGKSGAGGVYDAMRRGKSLLTGKRFKPSHGDPLS